MGGQRVSNVSPNHSGVASATRRLAEMAGERERHSATVTVAMNDVLPLTVTGRARFPRSIILAASAPQRNRQGGAWAMRARVIAVGVALCIACKASEQVPKPPAKLAGARVVDLIPVSLSGETWQDAEPFLALYASNPRLMAASAFTPNPGGSASATAPIFVSDDGGDSLALRNTVPR